VHVHERGEEVMARHNNTTPSQDTAVNAAEKLDIDELLLIIDDLDSQLTDALERIETLEQIIEDLSNE